MEGKNMLTDGIENNELKENIATES